MTPSPHRPVSLLATVAGCLALSVLGQFGVAAAMGMNPGQLLRLVLASTLWPTLRAILRASRAAWLRVAS